MDVNKFNFTTKSIQYAIYPIADFAAPDISRQTHLPEYIPESGHEGAIATTATPYKRQ